MNTAEDVLRAGRDLIVERGYDFHNWGFEGGALCPSGAIYIASGEGRPWSRNRLDSGFGRATISGHVAEAQWRLAVAFGYKGDLDDWDNSTMTSDVIGRAIGREGKDLTMTGVVEKFNEAIADCPRVETRELELV